MNEPPLVATQPIDRTALVRRGRWLSYATVGYNALEGIASIGVGGFARAGQASRGGRVVEPCIGC